MASAIRVDNFMAVSRALVRTPPTRLDLGKLRDSWREYGTDATWE